MIGAFGYLTVYLPKWVLQTYFILLLVGIGASILRLFPWKSIRSDDVLLFLGMGFAALAAVVVSVYFSWCGDFQAQGRYIITILPFVMMVACRGYDRLAEMITPRDLREKQPIAQAICACISGFVLCSVFIGYLDCLKYFGILSF